MKNPAKLTLFISLFTIVFFDLRALGSGMLYDVESLIENLGGVTYLYSTIGTIFAIFGAFTILSEWERWKALVSAVKDEVRSLQELWLWSKHFPLSVRKRFRQLLKAYVLSVQSKGWMLLEKGQRHKSVDDILSQMHDEIFLLAKDKTHLLDTSFSLFTELLKYRNERLNLSAANMPAILRNVFILSDALLIGLSLFIGVRSISLAYIFTLAVAVLGYSIYLLIDDLDHPLQAGGWHLTTKDYEELSRTFEEES